MIESIMHGCLNIGPLELSLPVYKLSFYLILDGRNE